MSVSAPIFTDTVNQDFFVESLGGSQQPVSYLDRFPNTIYSKALDSVLVTFAYALLGPVGAGGLRQEYLEARLQVEQAGLSTESLDQLYTAPFAFARAAEETYSIDASASLLPSAQRAQILAADAAFRNRATLFLKSIRAGGTLTGLSLAAQSALNHPVELIENYKYLYDQYADIPLGLPYYGTTTSLSEVIVLPRRDIPTSAQQTISLNGEPTSGWFTLSVPIGPEYKAMLAGTTAGSNVVTVPNTAYTPVGVYFTYFFGSTPYYGQVGSILSSTQMTLVAPPSSTSPGIPLNAPGSGSAYFAFAGNAQTIPLPYNASYGMIQSALWALPVIGTGNVKVTGGPLPDQPIVIDFTGKLSDQPIPEIIVNLAPNSVLYYGNVTGVGGPSSVAPQVSQLTDVTNNPLTISANVTVDQVGVSADSQTAVIPPADEHAMQIALDKLRPQTTFFTTTHAQPTTQRQPANAVYSGAVMTEVIRYETGNSGVNWPTLDNIHWIETGKEHEAPQPLGTSSYHYQGFHNVVNAYAYTEAALQDSQYGTDLTTVWTKYWDTMIGRFSGDQIAAYPFLAAYANNNAQYLPMQAMASSPDPLVITGAVGDTAIMNTIYPVDYLSLPGVPSQPSTKTFWASAERTSPGIDYLEIDLGSVQAVNYIYFEASNKPYNISVAYDVLDQNPARTFVPVTIVPPSVANSTTSLLYNASASNLWTTVELHFTNSLNQMIYTRFLRIGFTRTGGAPFNPAPGTTNTAAPQSRLGVSLPYSIEVRNLRIGRNISSDVARTVTIGGTPGQPASLPLPTLFPGPDVFPGSDVFPGT